VRDLAKSHAQVFIYLIFISLVTVTVMIKVMGRVRVSCRVMVRFNNSHVTQISYCELFGMTTAYVVPWIYSSH